MPRIASHKVMAAASFGSGSERQEIGSWRKELKFALAAAWGGIVVVSGPLVRKNGEGTGLQKLTASTDQGWGTMLEPALCETDAT